jgi:hypothetical protein
MAPAGFFTLSCRQHSSWEAVLINGRGEGSMENGYTRKVTRSSVWPETEAVVTYLDLILKKNRSIQGKVGDLGSKGMFLLTNEPVPLDIAVAITINFAKSPQMSHLSLSASGKTVRTTSEGVGIKFTSIDLQKLQKCIIAKLNCRQ